jgi:hypothetical protein
MALEKWEEAATSLRNVLIIYPDYRDGYSILAHLHHETLFEFGAALELHQNWLKHHPEDVSASADVAEALFTVARFEETVGQASPLLLKQEVGASGQAALRALEIGALVAWGRTGSVGERFRELKDLIVAQPPEFRVTWTWEGTKHFVQNDDKMTSVRAWLLSLISAMEGRSRDVILQGLGALADAPLPAGVAAVAK